MNQAAGFDHARLWSDTAIYPHRRDKSMAAAVALAERLRESGRGLAGVDSFLAAWQRLGRFDDRTLDRVWRDPYPYYWTRAAYELTGAVLSGRALPALSRHLCDSNALSAGDTLTRHLGDFQRIELAAALDAGTDWVARPALTAPGALAIPGSELGIRVDGGTVTALRAGVLEGVDAAGVAWSADLVAVRAATAEGPVYRAPVIETRGCHILMQPAVYAVPVNGLPADAADAPIELQLRQRGVIEDALALVDRHLPETFDQMRRLLGVIVCYRREGSRPGNISHTDLPGAVLAYPFAHPFEQADVLIHETHHHRLFFLEEQGVFLKSDRPGTVYSPWREDIRLVHGVLHAVYVFLPVARFWLAVVAAGEAGTDTLAVARARVARTAAQLRLGIVQLERFADFTASGQALFDRLAAEVGAVSDAATAAGIDGAVPMCTFDPDNGALVDLAMTVDQRIRLHIENFAPAEQAAALLG